MRHLLVFLGLWATGLTTVLAQTTYYVSTGGRDDVLRDGRSEATAWRSLAYACERVPAGAATLKLSAGIFAETKTATLKSGFKIVGSGPDRTTLTNAASFVAQVDAYCEWDKQASSFLIAIPNNTKEVAISGLTLTSTAANPLYGAIYGWNSSEIEIDNVTVREFSWSGVYLNRSGSIRVHHSRFEDASYERHCSEAGAGLRTRYVKEIEVDHCEFKTTKGSAYGYKGSGHEVGRIHDNVFHNNVSKGANEGRPFDLESAHEFEWDLEIYNNTFNGMVSVPRGGNQGLTSNSTKKTYAFSIRIHDNVFYGSGGVEGPRNYLEIDHNFFANKWGNSGRVFEIHGGQNAGPTKIHHNVAECSMGFVFKKNELNENISIVNNTVFLVNSDRNNFPTSFLEVSGAVAGWEVKNNVVFGDDPQAPAKRSAFSRGSLPATGMAMSHNVAYKVTNAPPGTEVAEPGLARGELLRDSLYRPLAAGSYVVDRGTDVGYAYAGLAPDLGAYEWRPLATGVSSVAARPESTWGATTPEPGASGFFHTGFSPNGDGVNDYFALPNLEAYQAVALEVYGRDGRAVYTSRDYRGDWFGEVGQQLLPEGTYFYRCASGDRLLYRGFVELRR